MFLFLTPPKPQRPEVLGRPRGWLAAVVWVSPGAHARRGQEGAGLARRRRPETAQSYLGWAKLGGRAGHGARGGGPFGKAHAGSLRAPRTRARASSAIPATGVAPLLPPAAVTAARPRPQQRRPRLRGRVSPRLRDRRLAVDLHGRALRHASGEGWGGPRPLAPGGKLEFLCAQALTKA